MKTTTPFFSLALLLVFVLQYGECKKKRINVSEPTGSFVNPWKFVIPSLYAKKFLRCGLSMSEFGINSDAEFELKTFTKTAMGDSHYVIDLTLPHSSKKLMIGYRISMFDYDLITIYGVEPKRLVDVSGFLFLKYPSTNLAVPSKGESYDVTVEFRGDHLIGRYEPTFVLIVFSAEAPHYPTRFCLGEFNIHDPISGSGFEVKPNCDVQVRYDPGTNFPEEVRNVGDNIDFAGDKPKNLALCFYGTEEKWRCGYYRRDENDWPKLHLYDMSDTFRRENETEHVAKSRVDSRSWSRASSSSRRGTTNRDYMDEFIESRV